MYSIITLIDINHGGWFKEGLCGNVKFLGDNQKYSGSWLVICSNCRYQYWVDKSGTTISALSDLCGSSLILDLQVRKCRIVVPSKIQGSGSGCQDISILLLINSNSKEICLVFQIFQQLKKSRIKFPLSSILQYSKLFICLNIDCSLYMCCLGF